MRYQYLTSKPALRSLKQRRSLVAAADVVDAGAAPVDPGEPYYREMSPLAAAVADARAAGKQVVLFAGGHAVKRGCSAVIARMIGDRFVTHLAGSGATAVHDFELSLHGRTSESVAENVADGTFGMWEELTELNDVVHRADHLQRGFGAQLGDYITMFARSVPSIFQAAKKAGVPATVHPLVGGDVWHPYLADPGAFGRVSYRDFEALAGTLVDLQRRGGVFLLAGAATTGPEVYLKALSWARNYLRRRALPFAPFDTGVFDLYPLPDDWRTRAVSIGHAAYYFRPWKTVLLRSLPAGGSSYYVRGDHRVTLPAFAELVRRAAAAPPTEE